MSRIGLCSLLLLLFVATHAAGQVSTGRGARGGSAPIPPPSTAAELPVRGHVSEELEKSYKEMGEAIKQPVSKRDYRVEVAPAEETTLFRVDPKLLANKFVATVLLRRKKPDADEGQAQNVPRDVQRNRAIDARHADQQLASAGGFFGFQNKIPDELLRLVMWDGRTAMSFAGRRGDAPKSKLSEQNKLFAKQCLPADRPAASMVEFLTSADCDRDVVRSWTVTINGVSYPDGWTYKIYAPTAQAAEQRGAALLQLIDGGMSRPMQRYLLEKGQKSLAAAQKLYEEIAEKSAAIRAEEAKLAKPSEISADILSQLKAQRVMVAVELAGLSARVKACDEMLKDPKKLEVSALQSISDMKVKAEIERVGIKEKLDQINTFISEGDDRQAIRSRIESLTATRNAALPRVRTRETEAATVAALFELYSPLPLVDDKIVVGPVEWTN